jgi:hypothetical protein
MYTSCIAQVVTIMHLFGRFAFKLSLTERYLPYSATDLQPISIVMITSFRGGFADWE